MPHVVRFRRVGSTNDAAVRRLEEDPAGTASFTTVLAETQTHGRGRLGRLWSAPGGRSLTASTLVLLPPSPRLARSAPWALLCAAMSVREAIAARVAPTGRSVSIAWPNDVMIDGTRKIAGLLGELAPVPELRTSGEWGTWVVLGVGVNVAMSAGERPTPVATSLRLEGDIEACDHPRAVIDDLLDAHLEGLRRRIGALIAHDGDAEDAGLLEELRRHCSTLGRPVAVREPDDPRGSVGFVHQGRAGSVGVATTVRPDGSLEVSTADGSTRIVTTGDVVLVGAMATDPSTSP